MTGVTQQQLQNASTDADTLEDIVNGGPTETVTTRLGRVVSTVAKTIADMAAATNVNAVQLANRTIDKFRVKNPTYAYGKMDRYTLLEHNNINQYDGGGTRRTVRYNIVPQDSIATSTTGFFFHLSINGWTSSTDTKKLIKLVMAGYHQPSSTAINEVFLDENGTSIAMGVNNTADGKVSFWFEVQNYYTNFDVQGLRIGVSAGLGGVEAALIISEEGVAI